MTDTLQKINAIRSATGASPLACRAVLESVHWEVAAAIEVIRRNARAPVESPFDDTDWFTGPPLSSRMIAEAEQGLGYKFPAAYIALLQIKNGGCLKRDCFPSDFDNIWARDHVAVTGIRGIGGRYGIDLATEKIVAEDWGYPDVGFVFAETPTAGHNVFMFDYTACGPQDNPAVIWVEADPSGPTLIPLARDLDRFMQGLVESARFELDE